MLSVMDGSLAPVLWKELGRTPLHEVQHKSNRYIVDVLKDLLRSFSALHPSTKQKFKSNVADESPLPMVGRWHKRLNKKPKLLYIPLECKIHMKAYFCTFWALIYNISSVLTFNSPNRQPSWLGSTYPPCGPSCHCCMKD